MGHGSFMPFIFSVNCSWRTVGRYRRQFFPTPQTDQEFLDFYYGDRIVVKFAFRKISCSLRNRYPLSPVRASDCDFRSKLCIKNISYTSEVLKKLGDASVGFFMYFHRINFPQLFSIASTRKLTP